MFRKNLAVRWKYWSYLFVMKSIPMMLQWMPIFLATPLKTIRRKMPFGKNMFPRRSDDWFDLSMQDSFY